MTRQAASSLSRTLRVALIPTILAAIGGCQSVESLTATALDNVSYGCADVELRGYLTTSTGRGRAIKVPEGTVIDAPMVMALCGK